MSERTRSSSKRRNQPRPHLADVSVVQKNVVWITGLPTYYSRNNLFPLVGKYGRIDKCAVNPQNHPFPLHDNGAGNSTAYVAYSNERSAGNAVNAINGTKLGTNRIRATIGENSYCSAFIKGFDCEDGCCLYLHEVANNNDRINCVTNPQFSGSRNRLRSFEKVVNQNKNHPSIPDWNMSNSKARTETYAMVVTQTVEEKRTLSSTNTSVLSMSAKKSPLKSSNAPLRSMDFQPLVKSTQKEVAPPMKNHETPSFHNFSSPWSFQSPVVISRKDFVTFHSSTPSCERNLTSENDTSSKSSLLCPSDLDRHILPNFDSTPITSSPSVVGGHVLFQSSPGNDSDLKKKNPISYPSRNNFQYEDLSMEINKSKEHCDPKESPVSINRFPITIADKSYHPAQARTSHHQLNDPIHADHVSYAENRTLSNNIHHYNMYHGSNMSSCGYPGTHHIFTPFYYPEYTMNNVNISTIPFTRCSYQNNASFHYSNEIPFQGVHCQGQHNSHLYHGGFVGQSTMYPQRVPSGSMRSNSSIHGSNFFGY
eukprot:CAMPEP_0194372154 /NCGR_PEP_ID=MMETSP0174-20130528/20463_1 /TAXON_ID=216777 /ORGANISM="Proboscia alata, Strain PI-D3" /LENGTH=536 /DNA_ID=CAMNT_0039150495 /DNA_START=27 /DNA_END=1637 /DNA_ORIENTATION=-